MLKILQLVLKALAKLILWRYRPKIIGITGSVGKTSAKEAIFSVLSGKFRIGKGLKNYNNEIGLPLTVIGAESAGRSIVKWFLVFLKALSLILIKHKNYPEILILEMGIDKPGDMAYLLSIIRCDVAILTKIGESHLEFFGSVDSLEKEKGLLITSLEPNAFAILNADDARAVGFKNKTRGRVITYALNNPADIKGGNLNLRFDGNFFTDFDIIRHQDKSYHAQIPAFGSVFVEAALAAVAAGIAMNMNLGEIVERFERCHPPKGRMNIIPGIKQSIVIDDTYNSAPSSAIKAIESIGRFFPERRKIAVLGDMLELGEASEAGHFRVGQEAAKHDFNLLVAVGEQAKKITDGAIGSGLPSNLVYFFDNKNKAIDFLKNSVSRDDVILVKGSQGMRMEKIVEALMASPEKAGELLVRQDKDWLK